MHDMEYDVVLVNKELDSDSLFFFFLTSHTLDYVKFFFLNVMFE